MYLENRLALGTLEIGGRSVSLAKSRVELYVLLRRATTTSRRGAGRHRTTQLAGGPKRFVLTSSGHIAGIVNPPGPKRRHWGQRRAAGRPPYEWLGGATRGAGLVVGGLGALGGDARRKAARQAAFTGERPDTQCSGTAPGTYVRG